MFGLVLGVVLLSATPAAGKKSPSGWDAVQFSGNWMQYEPLLAPGTGEEPDSLHIQAFDGEFELGKRDTRHAEVLVAQVGGGHCLADDGTYGTDTGHVIIGWHVSGGTAVNEGITFVSPYDGDLDVGLTLAGTRDIWEAEADDSGGCEGVALIDRQPIELDLDIALEWSSEVTPVFKNKKVAGYRVETTIGRATALLDGAALALPATYVAQSFPRSGPVWIPTGTFG